MSGHDITVAFMIGTVVMFGICALASRLRPEALELFGAAGLVTAFTFASRVWSANTDLPWSAAPWPIQDAICVFISFSMWKRQRDWWKLALAICFSVQTARHVPYWWGVFLEGAPPWAENNAYLWFINPLFGVELLILTVAGGQHVVSYVSDRLRVSLDRHPHGGAFSAGRR